jgi:hypothetical protein
MVGGYQAVAFVVVAGADLVGVVVLVVNEDARVLAFALALVAVRTSRLGEVFANFVESLIVLCVVEV